MSKAVLIVIIIILILAVIGIAIYLMVAGGRTGGLSLGGSKTFDVQGVKVEITQDGTGTATVKNGDTVSINYIGSLAADGKQFDSSYDRKMPISFTAGSGQVIKGMDVAIVGMKVGEKREMTIPAILAYGDKGIPPIIPANSDLIFQVELMGITPGSQAPV